MCPEGQQGGTYSISKKGLIIDQLTGRIDLDKVQRE
jgi:hypothetical protein